MEIKPVRNETYIQAALKEIKKLMDSHPGTPEGDRMDALVALVELMKPGTSKFPHLIIL
jgi:antitoxin component HigA of HigAB toxin-antitoxin module